MGAAGSPYAAFKRALKTGNVTLALAEARDLPKLNLADALDLVALLAEKQPELFERAAVRWTSRYLAERHVGSLAEANLVVAAFGVFREGGEEVLGRLVRRPR